MSFGGSNPPPGIKVNIKELSYKYIYWFRTYTKCFTQSIYGRAWNYNPSSFCLFQSLLDMGYMEHRNENAR